MSGRTDDAALCRKTSNILNSNGNLSAYESEIGPGFAALYNAITGNAELYRVDGKAFKLEQGFWIAKSASEYDSMYGLARGVSVNAYNYEDLRTVIKVMNPEADFTTFRTLVESYGYDDCLERRSN